MLIKYIIYISGTIVMFISLGIAGTASDFSHKNTTVLLVCEIIANISATMAIIILCIAKLSY